MSGWLVSATLVMPRSRMAEPAPALPEPPVTFTPAIWPVRMDETEVGMEGTSLIFTEPIELPTSRMRAAPAVPVMTTSLRATTAELRAKSARAPSAVTLTTTSTGWYPRARARTVCWPSRTPLMV